MGQAKKKFTDDDLDRGTRILVDDLLMKPTSFARDELLRRARKLRYHDYKGVDNNSIVMVKELKDSGFHELAQNAANGKYDQQKDASDEWAQTEDYQEALKTVENDPRAKAVFEQMKAVMESGALSGVKVDIPDDGPPEPKGTKGEA